MSTTKLLITTFGHDRPGIVEEIAGWVADKGANIEDSRMAQLGGEFATLILVTGDDTVANTLDADKEAFAEASGLTVAVRRVTERAGGTDVPQLRYELYATSLDHAGIVHQVSGVLRRHGINIVSAETRRSSAPFSGAPVFHLEMEIDVPSSLPVARLRSDLQAFGEQQNIDITLSAV